jgi:malate dehydrogenase (oxaloacetate-decarboxylating)
MSRGMAATATPLATPSAGYALTLRTQLDSTPGTLGRLTSAIGKAGGDVGALDVVAKTSTVVVRDISIACRDEAHGQAVVQAAGRVPGVTVESVIDRTFALHAGGKIEVTPRFPLDGRDELSMA